jgi:hypothetical protein
VIDGYGNAPIANGVVVIENDRIVAVGGRGQVLVPDGAEVISTEGMTVLPGLWDMQVQLMRLGHGDTARWNETYAPLAERVVMPIAARQLLQAGVTSARDVAPARMPRSGSGRVREDHRRPTSTSGPRSQLAPAGRVTGTGKWRRARARKVAPRHAGVDMCCSRTSAVDSGRSRPVSEARIRGLPVHAIAEHRPTCARRGRAVRRLPRQSRG